MPDEEGQHRLHELVALAPALDEATRQVLRGAIDKALQGAALEGAELDGLEAIVLPEGRPAIDILGGSFTAPAGLWAHLGEEPIAARLRAAIACVGRLEIEGAAPALPYAGTGCLVGPGLVMTNRHVARLFADGQGRRGLSLKPGLTRVVLDLGRERGAAEAHPLEVIGVELIHPHWDLALLRLGEQRLPHLTLGAFDPQRLVHRELAVIGYPMYDARNDPELQRQVFGNVFGVKRLQPGLGLGRRVISSGGLQMDSLLHDASTLGGNSGSAVIELESGTMVGLHFGGVYLDANFAVPCYELKRDPHVVASGARFTADEVPPSPSWLDAWKPLDQPG